MEVELSSVGVILNRPIKYENLEHFFILFFFAGDTQENVPGAFLWN